MPYYEELKDSDINEVIQKSDLMDYTMTNNLGLKRDFSKVKLTPRSERGNANYADF